MYSKQAVLSQFGKKSGHGALIAFIFYWGRQMVLSVMAIRQFRLLFMAF
jgi:hypothetical protein